VLLVLLVFRIPQSPAILLAPLVVFVAAFSFAAVGLLTTSLARTFDAFNFPLYLFITPMFFLSGTFVPLSAIQSIPGVAFIAQALPLTHAVALCRDLSLGTLGPADLWHFLWLVVVGTILSIAAINSMKRRLIP
jgi:lipooligosaccharide transport system permease protein